MSRSTGVGGAGTTLLLPDDGMTSYLPGATDRSSVTVQSAGTARGRGSSRSTAHGEVGRGGRSTPGAGRPTTCPGRCRASCSVEIDGGAFEVGHRADLLGRGVSRSRRRRAGELPRRAGDSRSAAASASGRPRSSRSIRTGLGHLLRSCVYTPPDALVLAGVRVPRVGRHGQTPRRRGSGWSAAVRRQRHARRRRPTPTPATPPTSPT